MCALGTTIVTFIGIKLYAAKLQKISVGSTIIKKKPIKGTED
jgi:hypothetical protein